MKRKKNANSLVCLALKMVLALMGILSFSSRMRAQEGEQIIQDWINGEWVSSIQYLNHFDPTVDFCRIDTTLTNHWSTELLTWTNSAKTIFEYDENDNLVQELVLVFDGEFYGNYLKINHLYDVNNKLLLDSSSMYSSDIEDWSPNRKVVYTYDLDGNLMEELEYYRSNDQWQEGFKVSYTFNANGQKLDEVSSYFNSVEWVHSGKTEYYYESDQLTAEWIYSFVNNAWESYAIDSLFYNGSDQLSLRKTYMYIPNGGFDLKDVTNYYYVGQNLEERITQSEVVGIYTNALRIAYSDYCTVVGVEEVLNDNLALFPNPTNGWLNVAVPNPTNFHFSIFSMDGKYIEQLKPSISNSMTQFNVSHLPAGIYTLRIESSSAQPIVRAFIVQ